MSFSKDTPRRNSYSSAKKSSNRKIPKAGNRNQSLKKSYSSSKSSRQGLYLIPGSKASPTFRPHYQSTNSLTLRPKKSSKTRNPHKKDPEIIGKTRSGQSLYSRFALANMTVDYSSLERKQVQTKRIPHSEQLKTTQWLTRINFHSYITQDSKELMEDPLRNGILFCELL